MKKYNVAFSINKNYLLFCFITIYSLVKNNSSSFFSIFIQHNNCLTNKDIEIFLHSYPLKNFNNFKIILIDCSNLKELEQVQDGGKWTKEVYFKLFLPDLLPTIDKILYLDADVIITDDIESFFNTPIDNKIFCGDSSFGALNCGVLLINLELARKTNVHKEIFSIIKQQYSKDKNDFYKLTEEYVINKFFKETIESKNNTIININPNNINYTSYKIIHYVGLKPWHLDRKIKDNFTKKLYIQYLNNLKLFAKNKVSKLLIIILFYYLIYLGYMFNSITRRIKNFICKNILHLPKYKYLHNGFTMSFFIKSSILSKNK